MFWKLYKKECRYVTWDGVTKQKYVEDTLSDDFTVMHNLELQSISKIRNLVIASGAIPTIIFACKSGQSAKEIEINGRFNGAFSYYYNRMIDLPKLTFKDAISRINEQLIASVENQTSEIICREDVLEMEMKGINGEKHCLLVFDMCRR